MVHNNYKKFIVSLIFLVFSQFNLLQAADPETTLTQLLEEHNSVGLSVAVVKDGEIVYSGSFGKKNMEQDTPLGRNDLFRIASISKSFSATAIMQFAEAGLISLDDDFSDLVGFKVRNPHYPETVITLRMVLSHTSSVSDKEGYFNLDIINPEKNPDWHLSYNDYEPGTQYQYCNLNYNMTGAVIEKLSGVRFDHHIKEQILDPLGLYGGFNVNLLDSALLAPIYRYNSESNHFKASANAYAPRTDEINNYTMGYSTPVFSPTGGMKISANDLAKYMIMHMNYGSYNDVNIISEESAKLMQTPIVDENGYGLALRNLNKLIPGKDMKGHTGSAYGLYSVMAFHPEEKFGFIAITNGGHPNRTDGVNNLLYDAVNTLYLEYIK